MLRRPWVTGMVLAALALPAAVRAGVPVALYPVQAEGLTDAERLEVQGVVEAALQGADRRAVLEPRTPLLVPGNCKAPITVGCVATFAKGGVVLYAKARRRGAAINVTVLFVDATGRKTRAVAFPIDLFIQNLRPAADAIATIEAELAAGNLEDSMPPPPPAALAKPNGAERPAPERPPEAAPAPPVERPREAPPPARAATEEPPARAPEPAEPAAAAHAAKATAPIDLTPRLREEPPAKAAARPPQKAKVEAEGPPRDWKRGAGRWTTGGGVALLVAGAVVGLTGKRLADSLQDRFDRGALRPEDEPLYDRVDRYEQIANVLFVAGGVVTAAGLTLQLVASEGGGAGVAMAGSF